MSDSNLCRIVKSLLSVPWSSAWLYCGRLSHIYGRGGLVSCAQVYGHCPGNGLLFITQVSGLLFITQVRLLVSALGVTDVMREMDCWTVQYVQYVLLPIMESMLYLGS